MFFLNSPLEQFEIIPLIKFPFIITNATIILLLGTSFFLFFTKMFNKGFLIPSRMQQIIESLYQSSLELTFSNIGEQGKTFFPFIYILFNFLLICNLVGMIPYSFTVTSHLIVTFSLALTIYIGFNILGFKKHKIHFFSLLLPGGASLVLVPLLVPIELVSYIFRVISLPVRLFANMMAGHTLLKVIAGFAWIMVSLNTVMFFAHFIPMILLVLLVGLEVGVAFIQAYVFTILTCMYINDALNLH